MLSCLFFPVFFGLGFGAWGLGFHYRRGVCNEETLYEGYITGIERRGEVKYWVCKAYVRSLRGNSPPVTSLNITAVVSSLAAETFGA